MPRDVVIVAASGPSGAGRALKPHLLGAELMGSASAYGVGGVHRHTPELLQNFRLRRRAPSVSFTPVLVPMSRGILATCTAPLRDPDLTADAGVRGVRGRLRRRAVRAPAAGGSVAADPVGAGIEHGARPGDRRSAAGRLVAVAALDNLTKGTAGGAVQCMNLALGLPETTGLPMVGVAP